MLNKRLIQNLLRYIALTVPLSGCSADSTQDAAMTEDAAVANPATQKCIDDGYSLEPVLTNNVPTGHVCINPANNWRCEVWEYFRGECALTN